MDLPQTKYAPLFLLAIALISLSSVAQEQLDDPMAPTNIKNVIDSNGINMATFQPGHGGMYVSIGNESSGIKRDPGRARYFSDNHTGTITEIKITATSSGYTYGPPELNGFGAGTFLKVDAQGRSEVFKYVGGSYVDFQDTGGALTCGSSECTYTDKYGLVVTFDKSLSDNYTSCYGPSINGQP